MFSVSYAPPLALVSTAMISRASRLRRDAAPSADPPDQQERRDEPGDAADDGVAREVALHHAGRRRERKTGDAGHAGVFAGVDEDCLLYTSDAADDLLCVD